jgi:UrcA family protein
MKTSIHAGALRHDLPLALAFAIGTLSLACVSAYAADLDPVTISAPAVKVVGQDSMTGAPIEQATATGVVKFNAVTLTTHSGVALLKDGVRAAARNACGTSVIFSQDEESCVNRAVQSAQPKVDAAIARARSNRNG